MRVLVCGGRDFADAEYARAYLDDLGPSMIIEGGAVGADAIAAQWARENLPPGAHVQFKADWSDLSHPDAIIRSRRDGTRYDARAGLRRNQTMIDRGRPDLVIAFPGDRGTADMVRRAKAAGIPVREVPPLSNERNG